MCRRFVGLGMLFLCFCMELLIGRNVYASQLQSGINDETALTSSVVWQFADQYDYGEIDETLKELFPKERLDFKEILIGVLSGDITFSAQLLKQLVKLMDDVNGEVLPPIKFFLKTYTKNLTNPWYTLCGTGRKLYLLESG